MKFRFKAPAIASAALFMCALAAAPCRAVAQSDPDLDRKSSSPIPQPSADSSAGSAVARTASLEFTPPLQWKREDLSGVVVYIAPGLKAGENARIIVLPQVETTDSLQSAFEKQMAEVRTGIKATLLTAGKLRELKGPQGSDAAVRMDVVELPSGAKLTCLLCCFKRGRKLEQIVSFTSSGDLYEKYLPEVNHFLGSVRFVSAPAASSRVLAAGNPNLTQEMVDRFNLFFEWLFDAPMTEEQRGQVRSAVVESWTANRTADIEFIMKLVEAQKQIEQKSEAERDIVRGSLQPGIIESLRKQPDSDASKWLLALYDRSHKAIAEGSPALTRQMSDAFIELLCFMHNESVPGDPFIVSEDAKNKFAAALADAYGKFKPELQKHIAGMPLAWAAMRYQWPKWSDQERVGLKDKFKAYLKTMAPEYLAEVHAPKPQNATAHAQSSPVSPAQSHSSYVFLSNMLTMNHVAMMNIIGNIGSGGYHYTYR